MPVRILTIPLDPDRELFRDEALTQFLRVRQEEGGEAPLTPGKKRPQGSQDARLGLGPQSPPEGRGAMREDYPLFVHWYCTLDWILSAIERFPRNARFSLASRISEAALHTLEGILEAIYTKRRVDILDRVNLYIEKQRVLFRMAKDRRYLSSRQYAFVSAALDETGRMVGGWSAWVRFFLRAVATQAKDAIRRSDMLLKLWRTYRDRMQAARASGLLLQLVDELFANPALTNPTAARRLSITPRAAQRNIEKLVAAGILEEATGQRRNRVYVAPKILRIIEQREPDGDS